MFINKLNQLYKPKRILYYVEAGEAEVCDFYKGNVPEAVAKYANAFGTYDYKPSRYSNSCWESLP